MSKLYKVTIKRVQYGDAIVVAENEKQAESLALDAVVGAVLPPYDAIDTVESVTEVDMEED